MDHSFPITTFLGRPAVLDTYSKMTLLPIREFHASVIELQEIISELAVCLAVLILQVVFLVLIVLPAPFLQDFTLLLQSASFARPSPTLQEAQLLPAAPVSLTITGTQTLEDANVIGRSDLWVELPVRALDALPFLIPPKV